MNNDYFIAEDGSIHSKSANEELKESKRIREEAKKEKDRRREKAYKEMMREIQKKKEEAFMTATTVIGIVVSVLVIYLLLYHFQIFDGISLSLGYSIAICIGAMAGCFLVSYFLVRENCMTLWGLVASAAGSFFLAIVAPYLADLIVFIFDLLLLLLGIGLFL